jgi:hypothetical protein
VGRGVRRDRGQRHRQPGTHVGQLGHGFWFVGQPVRAEPVGQHLPRGGRPQRGQREHSRAPGRHQSGQRPPAGHQHQAARAARQQRRGLPAAGRVVQHQQHPPARQQAAVQRGLRLGIGGQQIRGQPERTEQPGQQA